MEKNMKKNAHICITELLCYTEENKHNIVSQLELNEMHLKKNIKCYMAKELRRHN